MVAQMIDPLTCVDEKMEEIRALAIEHDLGVELFARFNHGRHSNTYDWKLRGKK